MKTIKTVLFLVLLLPSQPLLAQEKEARLCIYFKENTKNIKIEMNADSTHTEFTIWGIGFETKAKRKKALKEYRAHPTGDYQPSFLSPDLFSVDKPQKMTSLKALNCGQLVSVEEYRTRKVDSRKIKIPPLAWMIKKLDDHTFLVWDAMWYINFD